MSCKTFGRLLRSSRATDMARENHQANRASIAVAAGSCGQVHLIEDFRFFAGARPEAFRRELGNTGVTGRIGRAVSL
ncbi:hypothetical protein [Paraburkholderia youngii]|uniref:hypothetical protein n=1 Tax=Paraburkholderia youngii TaxID=2782701 RepID=UPI003D1F4266